MKRADLKDATAKNEKLAAEISAADETIAKKAAEIAKLTDEGAALAEKTAEAKAEHEEATKALASKIIPLACYPCLSHSKHRVLVCR